MEEERIDARLYISVRPYLEYTIPDVASDVRSALLGDVESEYTERMINTLTCRETDLCDPSDEWDATPELQSAAARVCTHACDYISTLSHAWVEYLTRLSQGLLREESVARRELDNIQRSKIAGESRILCIERIAQRVDAFLEECRSTPAPTVSRPDELIRATTELKNLFAASYGSVVTRKLMRLKQKFEYDLFKIQEPVAQEFAVRLRTLLRPPESEAGVRAESARGSARRGSRAGRV